MFETQLWPLLPLDNHKPALNDNKQKRNNKTKHRVNTSHIVMVITSLSHPPLSPSVTPVLSFFASIYSFLVLGCISNIPELCLLPKPHLYHKAFCFDSRVRFVLRIHGVTPLPLRSFWKGWLIKRATCTRCLYLKLREVKCVYVVRSALLWENTLVTASICLDARRQFGKSGVMLVCFCARVCFFYFCEIVWYNFLYVLYICIFLKWEGRVSSLGPTWNLKVNIFNNSIDQAYPFFSSVSVENLIDFSSF